MKPLAVWTLFVCIGLAGIAPVTAQSGTTDTDRYPLVPWPEQVEARDSHYVISERSRIALSDPSDPEMQQLGAFLAESIAAATGVRPVVIPESVDEATPNVMALVLDAGAETGTEGYYLSVTPGSVVLRAATPAGLFYAAQTFGQLLPVPDESDRLTFRLPVPAVEITDTPRFGYRGMHLDVARHFFPVDFIKQFIDLMAQYKMNMFHWHLTEDQGWRIEIKRYPKLTEIGATRKETLVGHDTDEPRHFDGTPYGGYYTQEEIREVVAYAQDRFVTIIPEIEMPGHAVAALAAYPDLGCTEGPFEVGTLWGVYEDILCPKEETFTFLENVLTEVIELFPGPYIHIGGDEAPKTRWEESEVAREVIEREGLADEHELQSYFIRRIETFLNAHDRKLIGWDEIVEGGLSPTATVMYWRHWAEEVPQMAAAQGNHLIMAPNENTYFDHYQADPAEEPLAIGGLTTLEDVYTYEPIPAHLTTEEAAYVLGAQGQVWTEYMPTREKVEYMVYPRMLALAEVAWSPKVTRDWASFQERLPVHLLRLDARGVNYRAP